MCHRLLCCQGCSRGGPTCAVGPVVSPGLHSGSPSAALGSGQREEEEEAGGARLLRVRGTLCQRFTAGVPLAARQAGPELLPQQAGKRVAPQTQHCDKPIDLISPALHFSFAQTAASDLVNSGLVHSHAHWSSCVEGIKPVMLQRNYVQELHLHQTFQLLLALKLEFTKCHRHLVSILLWLMGAPPLLEESCSFAEMLSELRAGIPQVSTLVEAERALQAPQERARLPLPSQAQRGAQCGAHAAPPGQAVPCPAPCCQWGPRARRPGTALARGLTVRTPGTAICLHLENAIPAACCGQLGSQNRETAFILIQNYKRATSPQGKHCSTHKHVLSSGNDQLTHICVSW